MTEHQQTQQPKKTDNNSQKQTIPPKQIPTSHPAFIIQRARINPKSLTRADVMQLQRTIGNRAVGRLLTEIGLIPSTAKPVQKQEIPEEDKLLQVKFESKSEGKTCPSCMQKQEIPEDEEPLQGKMAEPVQRQEIPEEAESLQTKRENKTGMPDNLKAGMESLSGVDMSDVRVHYNSDKPAEVGAWAYTQGTDVYIAPGQERHLPHEAWHVVQQAQGRVKPTMQLREMPVNDDERLEREANVIGEKAIQMNSSVKIKSSAFVSNFKSIPIQMEKKCTRCSSMFSDTIEGALCPNCSLTFDGIHGTNQTGLEQTLVSEGPQASKLGTSDPTQHFGEGLYYYPGGNVVEAAIKAKGGAHELWLGVYTRGLKPQTCIDTASYSRQDQEEILNSANHPLNLWGQRSIGDYGSEKILRPHLFDKDRLAHELRRAAAGPGSMDPRKELSREFNYTLKSFTNNQDVVVGYISPKLDANGCIGGQYISPHILYSSETLADMEDLKGPGVSTLVRIYGDLEIPEALFNILVNVAEFDFRAVDLGRNPSNKQSPLQTPLQVYSQKYEKTVPPLIPPVSTQSVGEKALPTKEELSTIINSAKSLNPILYQDQ